MSVTNCAHFMRHSLSHQEHDFETLRNDINWHMLLLRVCDITGVKLSPSFLLKLASDPMHFSSNQQPITKDIIEDLCPIVKHLHRIFFEEGTALAKMAISKRSGMFVKLSNLSRRTIFNGCIKI